MGRKKRNNNNGIVELKVVTAVLEQKLKSNRELIDEKFKNQREHFEEKFCEIKKEFEKGRRKMKDMDTNFYSALNGIKGEVEKNTKFRRAAKVVMATIATTFGILGSFIGVRLSKLFIK